MAAVLDLPLELLTGVCKHLDLRDLVRVAATCKRFRHGDGGLETLELPTKSPVITALRGHAFSRVELIPSTRPSGCSESWVAYLARCARQRLCRETPFWEVYPSCSLLVDAAGRLQACGKGISAGHDSDDGIYFDPTPVAAMAGVRVRSVAVARRHSLALGWDGRVYSWGDCSGWRLGHARNCPSPAPVDRLGGVRSIAANDFSFAVTQSGHVFSWGGDLLSEYDDEVWKDEEDGDDLRPTIVEGFGEARVRQVVNGVAIAFAVGEDGEVFSWGR
jgi:hypothetical protein